MSQKPLGLAINQEHFLSDEQSLREHCGNTTQVIWDKASPVVTESMARFIALSPFCCISSTDKAGNTDISPRGDAPGFVKLNSNDTLLLPDRPGNRRYDTFRNILETGSVSLLFMIPGVPITVRVNGTATISRDPLLLEPFAVKNRRPAVVQIIKVRECYGHCAKAIFRGKLWQDTFKIPASDAPSLATLMYEHLPIDNKERLRIQATIDKDLKDSMY